MAKPLVLLLDDDPAMIDAVSLDLEPAFDVICATGVDECVDRIGSARGAVDVAVIDMWIETDREGGLEAIRRIRALETPPECVVLTGLRDPAQHREVHGGGRLQLRGKVGPGRRRHHRSPGHGHQPGAGNAPPETTRGGPGTDQGGRAPQAGHPARLRDPAFHAAPGGSGARRHAVHRLLPSGRERGRRLLRLLRAAGTGGSAC